MARQKYKYGVPLGRSGCRFIIGDVSRGDLASFQFSRGGWSDAVRFARERARRVSGFMSLIDIVCGKSSNRMPLMQCYARGGGVHCEPETFQMREGEMPIAGLRRRRRK